LGEEEASDYIPALYPPVILREASSHLCSPVYPPPNYGEEGRAGLLTIRRWRLILSVCETSDYWPILGSEKMNDFELEKNQSRVDRGKSYCSKCARGINIQRIKTWVEEHLFIAVILFNVLIFALAAITTVYATHEVAIYSMVITIIIMRFVVYAWVMKRLTRHIRYLILVSIPFFIFIFLLIASFRGRPIRSSTVMTESYEATMYKTDRKNSIFGFIVGLVHGLIIGVIFPWPFLVFTILPGILPLPEASQGFIVLALSFTGVIIGKNWRWKGSMY